MIWPDPALERCHRELAHLQALWRSGHPERFNIALAIQDWLAEEILILEELKMGPLKVTCACATDPMVPFGSHYHKCPYNSVRADVKAPDPITRRVAQMRCTCGADAALGMQHAAGCPQEDPGDAARALAESPEPPGYRLEGGARRSERKPAYYMVDIELLRAAGERMEKGRLVHGRANYRQGGPEFVVETFDHLVDHLWLWLAGDSEDDHLAAVVANVQILRWHEVNRPENLKRLREG